MGSFSKYVVNFCSACYDHYGHVFLADQVDPEKLAEHIKDSKYQTNSDVEFVMLYAVVCRKQQAVINRMYKKMRTEAGIDFITHSLEGINIKEVQKDYRALYEQRKAERPKQIRSCSSHNA